MKTSFVPLLSLSLAATLAAQDGSQVFRLVPRNAAVVVQMDAPARWSRDFAGTRLGRFLQSQTVQDVVAPLREELDRSLEEVRQEAPPEAIELLEAIEAFGGRVTLAVDVQLDGDEPTFAIVIGLAGGAEEDLTTLCDTCTRAFESAAADTGQSIVEEPFGDGTLRAVGLEGGDQPMWLSLPYRLGDDVAFVFWSGERERVQRYAALDEGERFDPKGLEGSLAARVSLGPLMDELTAIAAAEAGPIDVRALFDRLGLTALRRLEISITPEDEFVATDFRIDWEGDGGVLDMFVPERQGRARLLDIAPTQATAWGVGVIRIGKLYDVLGGLWDDFADLVPMTREDAEREFADAFGVRLREDLLDHVGAEVLNVADASSFELDLDTDDPMAGIANQAYAFELKDAKAFGESFEKVLRARGMQAARKTTDYRGFSLHRLKLAGLFQVDYAITDRVFVLALNSRDPTHVRAILDEEAARRAGEPPAPMPEGVETRLARMPAGWRGVSVADISALSGAFRSAAEGALQAEGIFETPEELQRIFDAVTKIEGALHDQGLSRMVSVSWARKGEIRQRLLW